MLFIYFLSNKCRTRKSNFANKMSKLTYSYGARRSSRSLWSRSKRMDTSSSHENCNCFISNNPSGSSRHFENTFKVIEKKRNSSTIKRASSLSSILEEPPTSLDLELEVIDRLRDLNASENSATNCDFKHLLEKRIEDGEESVQKIYFLSKDRTGATTLRMKFVNSLNNLSSSIRNGISGKFFINIFRHCNSLHLLSFLQRLKRFVMMIK